MPSADLSIRHQKRRFGFATLLLLPSSSMEFLRVKESLTYEFYPSTRPDTSSFVKAKHSTNQRIISWENKGSQETEEIGERKGHHGRGSHHGLAMAAITVRPWCSLAGGVPFSSPAAFWCIFFVCDFFSLDHLIWAYWACLANSFGWAWLQFLTFSPKTWLDTLKSAIKTQQSQNRA